MKLNEDCDICGGKEYLKVYENKFGYPYDLVKCVQCDLLTIHPKTAQDEVASLYNTPVHTADPLPKRDVNKAAKRIEKLKTRRRLTPTEKVVPE